MSQVALAPQGNKRPYVLRKGIAKQADLDLKPVVITSSTKTLNRDEHAGRLIILNRAAGIAITLPAATGTGDVYPFHVLASFTGAASIKVASASDEMQGNAILFSAVDTVNVQVHLNAPLA